MVGTDGPRPRGPLFAIIASGTVNRAFFYVLRYRRIKRLRGLLAQERIHRHRELGRLELLLLDLEERQSFQALDDGVPGRRCAEAFGLFQAGGQVRGVNELHASSMALMNEPSV